MSDVIVTSIVISDTNIFAATFSNGVFLSTNNGNSWRAINNGLLNNISVYSLAFNGSDIFNATSKGLFLSTNDGNSWRDVRNDVLNSITVYSLMVTESTIFAGTKDNGVFFSTDNGTSWIKNNNGLPDGVTVFELNISDSHIFIGTDGMGMFKRERILNSIDEKVGQKQVFSCSPNPCNAEVKIQTPFHSGEYTEQYITDIHGRKIMDIPKINEYITIATNDWTEGVYCVVLRTSTYTMTEKLMVIR